jgi:hypothetical protein
VVFFAVRILSIEKFLLFLHDYSGAVFLQPSNRFDPTTVRLIITQATPHQAPVIDSDSYVVDFYSRVNKYWKNEWNNSLQHLVVLSLAGGDR